MSDRRIHYDDLEDVQFKPAEVLGSKKTNSIIARFAGKISTRAWKVLMFAYNFVDRTILILGYITLCTGVITFGRFFVS